MRRHHQDDTYTAEVVIGMVILGAFFGTCVAVGGSIIAKDLATKFVWRQAERVRHTVAIARMATIDYPGTGEDPNVDFNSGYPWP
jgi:hypothetical protein